MVALLLVKVKVKETATLLPSQTHGWTCCYPAPSVVVAVAAKDAQQDDVQHQAWEVKDVIHSHLLQGNAKAPHVEHSRVGFDVELS